MTQAVGSGRWARRRVWPALAAIAGLAVSAALAVCVAPARAGHPQSQGQDTTAAPAPRPALMPPDGAQNAASGYLRAMRMLGIDPTGVARDGALTREDWEVIWNQMLHPAFAGRSSPQWRARAAEIMERAQPAIDALREASQAPASDWGLDRSAGMSMLLPHLANQRNLARLMSARAQFALENGDAAVAVESLDTIMRLGAHSGQDRVVVSSLVSSAVMMMGDGRMDSLIGSGMLSAEQAKPLAELYAQLSNADPAGCIEAIRGEAEMMTATMRAAIEADGGKAMAGQLKGLVSGQDANDAIAQLEAFDEAASQRQIEQYAGWMDRTAGVFAMGDIDAARAAMAEINAEIDASPDNAFSKLMMPALDRMMEAHFSLRAMLAERAAQLKAIADGTVDPASLANAAWFLILAGNAAAGLDEIDQQAIEMMRIDCGVAPADQAMRARDMIVRSERLILEMLERAARTPRCDFLALGDTFTLEPPSLDIFHGARIRAAVRVVLADAVDRACRGDGAPAIVRRLAVAFAVSQMLSRDPAVGRSLFARAVFTDALAAMDLALARKAVSVPDLAPVLATLRAFDAADPFGTVRGRDADADFIGRSAFAHHKRRIVAPELVDRIAAAQRIERARPPVAFIDAAWRRDGAEALQAAPFVPGAPLLLATDVHDPVRVKAFLAGEQPTSIDMDLIVTGAPALLDRAHAAAGDAEARTRAERPRGGANERRAPD